MQRLNAALRRLPTWPVWALGTLPLLWLAVQAGIGALGPDPVRALEHGLGLWSLRLLLAALAVTPLMRVGLRLLRFRRALGVLGFAYAACHLLLWAVLDMALLWPQIAQDLVKRPYIVVGMAALLMLVPLAVTSTDGWLRRLGPERWRRLHRLAYPAILLGAIHFVMVGKVWTADSLAYLGVTLGLLALRLGGPRKRPFEKA